MKKSCSRTIFDNCSHILQLQKKSAPRKDGEKEVKNYEKL